MYKTTMHTTKNAKLRTHIEIIKSLLDGSKKTQKQIAKETDYEKSTISHALKDLQGKKVINRVTEKKESGYTNKGIYDNKLCWLTYEIDNGKHILDFLINLLNQKTLSEQYKENILKNLQENNLVINMLLKQHYHLVGNEQELLKFKACLTSSPTFFKKCLLSSTQTLLNTAINLQYCRVFGVDKYVYDEDIALGMLRGYQRREQKLIALPQATKQQSIEIEEKPIVISIQRNELINALYHASRISDMLNSQHNEKCKYILEDPDENKELNNVETHVLSESIITELGGHIIEHKKFTIENLDSIIAEMDEDIKKGIEARDRLNNK